MYKTKKSLVEWMNDHLQSGVYYVAKFNFGWGYTYKHAPKGVKYSKVTIKADSILCKS